MIKTGGTSLERTIYNKYPELKEEFKNYNHLGVKYIPKKFKELESYSIIRNPIDWYISLYYYFKRKDDKDSINILLKNNKGDYYSLEEFLKTVFNFKNKINSNSYLSNQLVLLLANKIPSKGFIRTHLIKINNQRDYLSYDVSLYEYFFNSFGCDTAINIPLEYIKDFEKILDIGEIKIDNKYEKSEEELKEIKNIDPKLLLKIKETHKKFYDIIDNYKPL